MMKHTNILFLTAFLLSTGVFAKDDISFNKELSLQADNLGKLVVDVGGGALIISGEDVNQISVKAKIYSEKYNDLEALQEAFAEKMIFTLEEQGDTAKLRVVNKKTTTMLINLNPEIYVDLTVVVPKSLQLDIDDGSGSMKISDIDAVVRIDDGSGSMQVSNINADLYIDDGSGSIQISNIVGDLDIDDGSGSQTIENVTGNIVSNDGSGSISISNVAGNVSVDDSSGSISVVDMAGEFTLVDDGSGSVTVNGKNWKER